MLVAYQGPAVRRVSSFPRSGLVVRASRLTMSSPREGRFKITSVWADQPMLGVELNSGLHDDWRIVTVFFQPDFKDALGNNHRASYITVWERKDA